MKTFTKTPRQTPLRRLNPLNDYLFLKVMGEKGDEIQLLGFINAVLRRTGENRFRSVEILENKTFTPEVIGDKSSVLDVRAVLHDSTRTNIEVQLRNQHNMDRRSLFYWSKEYADSLEAGQDYRKLPNVLAINIVNYDFPPVREVHSCFHLREDKHREYVLTEALEIHYLNMVQYRKQAGKDLTEDPLNRWLAWFNMCNGEELAAEAAKMDAAIQAANERMVYVTGDKEAIRAYERRQMALSDYNSTMNYARDVGIARGMRKGLKKGQREGLQKGRAEGLVEGMEKEKLEIARKMKNAGRPLSEIAEFTGLPVGTIEQM
jgi:predicted transposase/invertase (TIGR01784 family)